MNNSHLTFLSTEIEGSRQLWDQYPEAMRTALTRHDALMRQAIETHHGTVCRINDGAILAAFSVASFAAAAALAGQRSILGEAWGVIPMRVRIALHSGPAMEKDGSYFGPTITLLAYLLKAAHGGQILLSGAVHSQLENDPLPEMRSLGLHHLLDLYSAEECFQLVASGLPEEFPPLHTLEHYSHNLPLQSSPFMGWENEMGEIGRLLIGMNTRLGSQVDSNRLTTLVGVGGAGKTRLALQAAASLLEHFPDGAWLAEMGPLVDPELAPQAIANALGMRNETGKDLPNALIDYLHTRQLLLILDQCESLLEACTQLADTLLRTCPNLKILATCREALRIPGETVYQMPSLSLPDSEAVRQYKLTLAEYVRSDAVALFAARAVSVQSEFSLTEQNAPVVAQICQRLDGMPLAIELAAMRVKTLPVDSILVRIENRFRLLTGSPRIPLSRLQIIRTMFDWSFDLLSPSERTLLSRLAVFTGGWTLKAAAEVCADDEQIAQYVERRTGIDRRVAVTPWDGLERRAGIDRRSLMNVIIPAASIPDLMIYLVEKGLVARSAAEDQNDYRMLEPVRQFSREKLLGSGEANRLHSSHLSYYSSLAVEADQHLWTADQAVWYQTIAMDINNIRTALEWAEASPEPTEVEAGLRLAGAMWQYWIEQGCWSEGRARLERLFARSDATGRTPEMARALNLAGILAAHSGNPGEARPYLEHAQAIGHELGDQIKIAHSLYGFGLIALLEKNLPLAQQQYEASLAMFRTINFQAGITLVLKELGELALQNNESEKARLNFEESQAICRQMGNRLGAAQAANALGSIAKTLGDLVSAQRYYAEALTIFREIHHLPGIAEALMGLGSIPRSLNGAAKPDQDLAAARGYLEESLTIYRKLGLKRRIAFLLIRLDEIARSQGDYTAARKFYEESLVILGDLNPSGGIIVSLNDLGKTSLMEGDPRQAASFFQEALALATETGDKQGIASSLFGLALVFQQLGKTERWRWAARLMGQAEMVIETTGASLRPEVRSQIDAACNALRKKLGESVFDTARAEGRAMPLGQAISYGLEKIPIN